MSIRPRARQCVFAAFGFTACAVVAVAVVPRGWTSFCLAIMVRVSVLLLAAAGLTHTRPAHLRPWWVLFAGVGVGALGDTFTELPVLTRVPQFVPAAALVAQLAAFVLVIASAVLFSRARRGPSDRPLPLDVPIVATALVVVLLQFVETPDGQLTVSSLARAWPLSLLVGMIGTVIVAVRLAVVEPVRKQVSLLLLLAGAITAFASTLHLAVTRPGELAGAPIDVAGWLAGALLGAAAAWHPSASLLTERGRPRAVGLLTARHAATSLTLLAIPATLVISAVRHQPVHPWRTAATSLILLALIAGQTALASRAEHAARGDLAHRAVHDSLTGLGNRALLDDALSALHDDSRHAGQSMAVFFLDLVNFKRINDSLGHTAGDHLLMSVADRLRSQLRDGDVLARFGGDEFVVAAPLGLDAGPDAATALAKRILTTFASPFDVQGHALTIRAAVGATVSPPDDSRDVAGLLRDADTAMYSAKRQADGYALFNPAQHRQVARALAVEVELRRAFANGEIVLHYQPVVPLTANGRPGYEALVRWNHPQRGLVSPGEFLPVVAAAGLDDLLAHRTLTLAAAQLAAWSALPDPPYVTVNLSGAQLRTPGIVDLVTSLLTTHHLEPDRLVIEVTEDSLIDDEGASAQTLRALATAGVRLAIDDFGTGYSCLAYLSKLPVHLLKVDRAFVAELGTGGSGEAVIAAIVDIARAFQLSTVAEGVETAEQLHAVRALGCDSVQGYLLGRPAAPTETITSHTASAALASHLSRAGQDDTATTRGAATVNTHG
ncbi:putative bifunctional diguanylate cyclase/phosphodiesterase [Couchioplanes azureus]|uniref:putative bifunctional diguanylate cyclase/phosphodiesterase n=1 Tax=Couchioplanes caeruleus TaxID=56438 RepID=UPI001670D24E|nr:GGDEF domain-containing phosphodiesterase [Couchioplanes caeruleus]